jgi:hypothetical protein
MLVPASEEVLRATSALNADSVKRLEAASHTYRATARLLPDCHVPAMASFRRSTSKGTWRSHEGWIRTSEKCPGLRSLKAARTESWPSEFGMVARGVHRARRLSMHALGET